MLLSERKYHLELDDYFMVLLLKLLLADFKHWYKCEGTLKIMQANKNEEVDFTLIQSHTYQARPPT